MATFNPVEYDGDDTVGPAIYNIKETLVAEGWTVRGSGDGLTRHGDIDGAVSVPLAERGNGGEYDCWTSGSTAFTGVAGGAGNTEAWCWLRSPSGDRDVILTSTDDGFTDSNGRVGYTRKGAGGFVGGATDSTTFPAAPVGGAGDETWGNGSRETDGAITTNLSGGTPRHDVVYADGEWWWRIAYYDTGGSIMADAQSWSGIFPIVPDTAHPNDPDPAIYGRLRVALTNPFAWWEHTSGAFVTPSVSDFGEISSFAATHDGLRVLFPLIMENGATNPKGTVDPKFLLSHAADETQGERVTMPDGRVHLIAQVANRLHFIVPDNTVTLTDVTMADLDGYNVVPESSEPEPTIYINRIWHPSYNELVGESIVFRPAAFYRWETEDAPDPTGVSYDGPVDYEDTSDFCVEIIR